MLFRSRVTVTVPGGPAVTAGSHIGWARVWLKRKLSVGEECDVTSVACGPTSAVVKSPPAEAPTGVKGRLRPPEVPKSVHECQRSIEFDGLLPGTVVVLTRDDGKNKQEIRADSWGPGVVVFVDPPIDAGEKLTARSSLDQSCEIADSDEVVIPIVSGPLPAPVITTQVCPASRAFGVGGLAPSAQVLDRKSVV